MLPDVPCLPENDPRSPVFPESNEKSRLSLLTFQKNGCFFRSSCYHNNSRKKSTYGKRVHMNIETVIDNLSKRRFQAHHFANRADAVAFLKEEIISSVSTSSNSSGVNFTTCIILI